MKRALTRRGISVLVSKTMWVRPATIVMQASMVKNVCHVLVTQQTTLSVAQVEYAMTAEMAMESVFVLTVS